MQVWLGSLQHMPRLQLLHRICGSDVITVWHMGELAVPICIMVTKGGSCCPACFIAATLSALHVSVMNFGAAELALR